MSTAQPAKCMSDGGATDAHADGTELLKRDVRSVLSMSDMTASPNLKTLNFPGCCRNG